MEPETIENPTETRDLEAPFETASIVDTDRGRESDNPLRVRIRSNSEFSEGDNTRNDGGINSVAFSKTLSNFYILHTLKSSDQTSVLKFIGLSVLCLFVVTIQFVALYMISYAFRYLINPFYVEYGTSGHGHMMFDMFGQIYPKPLMSHSNDGLHMSHQKYTYRNSLTPPFKEDTMSYFSYDDYVLPVPTYNVFIGFMIVFTFILCGLLSKSLRSTVSSSWICFCYDDDDRYPRNAYYHIMSMFLKALNLALSFCIFVFIVNVLCFALYFGVAIAMDWRVFLFPIAAVCIARLDEWTFSWMDVARLDDFWSVRVTKHYRKTRTKLVTGFVFMHVSWAVAWYLSSNHLYFWNGAGIWARNSCTLITLCALGGAMLLLLPMNPTIFRGIVHHFIGDVFVMMLSFAAAVVMLKSAVDESYPGYYVAEWSRATNQGQIGDTYRAPISPERSIPGVKAISVVAMVFCGLNLVLFLCEVSGTPVGKYRIFVSIMPPLMCFVSYVYCLAQCGLVITNVWTQFGVLFATPVIILMYVGNWKQMLIDANAKPYPKPYGWFYAIGYVTALGLIIVYAFNVPGFTGAYAL